MPTLHMEVEAMLNVQRKLMQLHSSIQNIIQSTNSYIYGLPPHWQGNSANEFFTLYNESISQISAVLEPLSEMAAELAEEIARWERVAERLSR